MKVLILTEGGGKIGFGHITRCCAIYEAFKEKNITPEFIINADKTVKDILKNKKYKIFNWNKNRASGINFAKKADVVIIDSYIANLEYYTKISKIAKIPVYIDDAKRLNYPSGIVINGSIFAEQLDYPKKKNIVYLIGAKYVLSRKEFWDVSRKIINKKIKNVLIAFGGVGRNDFIYNIAKQIKHYFDIDIYIVDSKKRISAKKMLNLMCKADICISGGGQTINELARCGVPTIGICFAENQILNLKGWRKAGFIEFAGWYNDKNILRVLVEEIKRLDYKKRLKMSRVGQGYIDGEGARQVVKDVQNNINLIERKEM